MGCVKWTLQEGIRWVLRIIMAISYVIYCTPDGDIKDEPRLHALAFGGQPLEPTGLIPLPDGATLSMMPDRLAVGETKTGEREVITRSRGWAAAALLPIGYTRTLLPAYEKVPHTEPLPFSAYIPLPSINAP